MHPGMLAATPSEARFVRVLGALVVMAALLASPAVLVLLSPDRQLSFSSILLILLFDLAALVLGVTFLRARRKQQVFRAALAAISAAALLLGLFAGGELFLSLREHASASPESLNSIYDAFSVQHLHPFYYFFFPQDEKELARINNAVVSVTPEGFRGPGPDRKGSRRLAFLLGGSAAFGDGASSNETTISGYLNTLQPEYHFVNAGVPSWNSTQEFYRVAMQLLQFRPDLIVVYDGYNDANCNDRFPPGTPESYENLARWVDDIRSRPSAPPVQINWNRLAVLTFPRIRYAIDRAMDSSGSSRSTSRQAPSPDPASRAVPDAAFYLWNVGNMARLAASRGTRLVVFWQAVRRQHRKITPEERSPEADCFRYFHRYVLDHRDPSVEFHDLSDLFDHEPTPPPASDVFLDSVHLTDRGNQRVAWEVWRRLANRPGLVPSEVPPALPASGVLR